MKIKTIFFYSSLFLITAFGFAQKKDAPKSIINNNASIKKYHNAEELKRMQKGELLKLYTERMKVLVSTLPHIAFATKPGITMATLGIPDSKENTKALDNQIVDTYEYIDNTISFQSIILPYSDTSNLAKAIIFYEEIMKSLHSYDEFD